MSSQIVRPFLILLCIYIIIINSSCKDSGKSNSKPESKSMVRNDTRKWENLMIEGYQKFNTDRSVEAAEQIFEATELMPKKNLENYLVCAMVYAQNDKKEKAFMAIEKAIEEGFKDSELLNSITEYSILQNDTRWNKLISQTKNIQEDYENSIQNPKLLEVLKKMWIKDQEVLAQYEKKINSLDSTATNDDYRRLFKPVENRWEINKNKLDSITNIHGWPGNKLVGEEGAKIAWGIPQHSPNIFFKRKCLLLIKEAVKKGDVDPIHYAQLHDRIARETWTKQTYGTSMGDHAPFPIKNPIRVNERRSKLGLFEPIEVYAIYHGFKYNSPSTKEVQSGYEKAQDNYRKFENFIQLKKADSANYYISQAISAHGDISNEQLYNAAIKLAQLDNQSSQRKSMRILKVLIWRKWESRFKISLQDEFKTLKDHDEWEDIPTLIEMSR